MLRTIDIRVFQQCHFPTASVSAVASDMAARFAHLGTKTVVLNRGQAMALIWTGDPTQKGPTEEVRLHTLKLAPIALALNEYLDKTRRGIETYDPLAMWVPDWKYDIDMWLPPGETNGRFIRTGYEGPYNGARGLHYTWYFKKKFTEAVVARFQEILSAWSSQVSTTGFGGEVVSAGSIEAADQTIHLRISDYLPVAFPWLELYLRLRSDLPRTQWPYAMAYQSEGDPRPEIISERVSINEC